MSVSNTLTSVNYVGDGSQTDFAITFDFKSATHVKAFLKVIATGVETAQVQGVDFTVVGTDVVMAVAPASTRVLYIYREAPLVQLTEYSDTGPFLPSDHEEAMDKLALLIQEVARDVARAVKLSIGDASAIDPLLVSPPTAGSVLTINATLDGMEYLDPSTLVGPQGPQGDPGPTGAAGSNGAPGAGILRAGSSPIGNAQSTHTVVFSSPTVDANYVVAFNIVNTVDAMPIFLVGIVTGKTVNGFTVTFNTQTDTANYVMEYNANDAI